MFGLSSLFKKQSQDAASRPTTAPQPTLTSEPVCADYVRTDSHPTAPGTHIGCCADLVGKLHAAHAALLTLFVSIQACVGAQDWALAGRKLGEFRRALQAHLLTENVRFYVCLEHMLAGDKLSHDLMHDFRRDMAEIGEDVMAFLDKYRDLAVRPDLAATFATELITVGTILTERIQREEDTLYPVYTPA